jgi:CheY-like chemotaxis protein
VSSDYAGLRCPSFKCTLTIGCSCSDEAASRWSGCAKESVVHALAHIETMLIVEDEYFISAELAHFATSRGVRTAHVAAGEKAAVQLIETGIVQFATVDVYLRDGMCDALVEALLERSIPFVYVSGLQRELCPHLPPAPWVAKPIDYPALLAAIVSAAGEADASDQSTAQAYSDASREHCA